jgi:hypothetical protein
MNHPLSDWWIGNNKKNGNCPIITRYNIRKERQAPCCRLCAAVSRYSYKGGIVSRRERKRPVLGRMKAKILSAVLFIWKTNFLFLLIIMKVDHGVENEAG